MRLSNGIWEYTTHMSNKPDVEVGGKNPSP